jgi:hypothetical protein
MAGLVARSGEAIPVPARHRKRFVPSLVNLAQSRIAPVLLPSRPRVIVSRCMNFANSLSHSRQTSTRQWFGITAYALIRIGDSSRASPKTCANA